MVCLPTMVCSRQHTLVPRGLLAITSSGTAKCHAHSPRFRRFHSSAFSTCSSRAKLLSFSSRGLCVPGKIQGMSETALRIDTPSDFPLTSGAYVKTHSILKNRIIHGVSPSAMQLRSTNGSHTRVAYENSLFDNCITRTRCDTLG